MKYLLSLAILLSLTWLAWSGHFDEPFLLILAVISVLFSLWIVVRMRIVDNETAPLDFGVRPLLYLPYLLKEVIRSNFEVSRIVMSPRMKLQRNMIEITGHQKTEIGRVVLANSITLTPGTVAIRVEGQKILVHALSFAGAEEDLSGEMDRRVCKIEPPSLSGIETPQQTARRTGAEL